MKREKCTNCGIEEWAEKMHFCANDGMWFCSRCGVFMGLADSQARCPRCYEKLIGGAEVTTPAVNSLTVSTG